MRLAGVAFGRTSWIAILPWRGSKQRKDTKKGITSHPSSAAEPLLTLAERKELQEHRASSLLIGDLCVRYLAYLQNPNDPESVTIVVVRGACVITW